MSKRTTPSISLRPEERQFIEAQAEKAGVSMGRYIKQVVLGERRQAFMKTSVDIPEMEVRHIIRQLSAIGNNINQLARIANADKQTINSQKLEQMREQLTQTISYLLHIIT